MDHHHRIILILFAVTLVIPVVVKGRWSTEKVAPAAFSVQHSPSVRVSVKGAVSHPGIYETGGIILTDSVINMADPLLNLKDELQRHVGDIRLENGMEIRIESDQGRAARISTGSIPVAQRMLLGIPLDINRMDEADFDRLPEIGAVLARRIVEYRQYNGGSMRVNDLLNVAGIGIRKFNMLKPYF